jgi:hypothetical protein
VHTRGVLLALLATPAAAIVIFLTLGCAVWTLYALSDVKETKKLPGRRPAHVVPRWSVAAWWSVQRATWRQSKRRWITLLLTAASGGIRIFSGALVGLLCAIVAWIPLRVINDLNGKHRPPSGPPAATLVGLLFGALLLVSTIRYATGRRNYRLWSPPAIYFPAGVVSVVNRFDFLRAIWLYTWLCRCADAAKLLSLLTTSAAFVTISTTGRAGPASPTFTANDGYVLLWILSLVLGSLVGELMKRIVAIAMPAARAVIAVHRCLHPPAKHVRKLRRTARYSGVIDVLGERRVLLAQAVRTLDVLSSRIDLASAQHPVASILRACGRRLLEFMASSESLVPDYPIHVTTLLNDIIVVLAGPTTQQFHATVGRNVDAFDSDGLPRVAQLARPTRRWATIITRAAENLDQYSKFGTAMWGIFTLVVVVVLLLQGALDLSRIQLQK